MSVCVCLELSGPRSWSASVVRGVPLDPFSETARTFLFLGEAVVRCCDVARADKSCDASGHFHLAARRCPLPPTMKSRAQRARRQLCLLLSLAVACRASPLLPSPPSSPPASG